LAVSVIRRSLVSLTGPAASAPEKLSTTDTQQRQHGHGQNQNPHAPHPLHEGTPDIDGHQQLVQTAEHRGPAIGQADTASK
jgi:hypothetical protein